MKVSPYKKSFDYSYTIGIFPTIELLKNHAGLVLKVLVDDKSLHHTGIKNILNLCKQNNIKIEYAPNVIAKLSVKENTYVLAVFKKQTHVLQSNKNHILLVNPMDPGNLGTIIRSMVGFNFTNLAIITPGVDCYDPKVVRSAMGALFEINFEYFDHINNYLDKYKNGRALYSFMLTSSKFLSDLNKNNLQQPYTLIFGNEGEGLDSYYQKISTPIKIPQSSKIDSLNLSVSASIAMYKMFELNS